MDSFRDFSRVAETKFAQFKKTSRWANKKKINTMVSNFIKVHTGFKKRIICQNSFPHRFLRYSPVAPCIWHVFSISKLLAHSQSLVNKCPEIFYLRAIYWLQYSYDIVLFEDIYQSFCAIFKSEKYCPKFCRK